MKKTVSILLAITIPLLLLLGGCTGQKLADGFDEAEVKEAAKAAVTALNDADYKAFSQQLDSSIKESLSENGVKAAIAQVMPDAGAFQSFESETAVGQKDQNGDDCAVVVLKAVYENQTVTYTISLNADLKLIGFYLK